MWPGYSSFRFETQYIKKLARNSCYNARKSSFFSDLITKLLKKTNDGIFM